MIKHRQHYTQLVAAITLMLIGFFVFGPAGHDDSHITYAVALQLTDTGQILNINGERVEQGSSLLHVVMLALLFKLPWLSPPTLGILFTLFVAIACIPLQWRLAKELQIKRPSIAVLLLVLSTSFSYWAVGGLEAPLVALLMLWLVFSAYKFISEATILSSVQLLVVVGLMLMSRPEMPFVLIAAGFAFICLQAWQKKKWLIGRKRTLMIAIIMILIAVLLVWRYFYFGQIFPQPVYAKSAGGLGNSLRKIGFGLLYFGYAMQLSIVFYAAVFGVVLYKILRFKNATLLITLLISCISALLAFVVISGGDWMTGGRFFVPVIPMLILLALWYLQSYRCFSCVISILVLVCVLEIGFLSKFYSTGMAVQHFTQFDESLVEPIDWEGYSWVEKMNYIHIGNIVLINHMRPIIDEIISDQKSVTVLTIQMGMVPYYLQRQFPEHVKFVDMRGLTTKHIPSCYLFSEFPVNWQGIFVRYRDYFQAQQTQLCDLPTADLIFDLLPMPGQFNEERLQAIKDHGYVIVFYQEGKVITNSAPKSQDVTAFVAIKGSVYERIAQRLSKEKYTFEYH